MDIRLQTFICVAKTKSYTRSAELLNITQPAVSQHIKYLEQEYGVSLINKCGRSFDLTQEGLILFKYAEKIEDLYRVLEVKLKNKTGIVKNYNLGASMTIGGYVLPPILAKYRNIHENVNILLQVNNTEEILEKLIYSKIDFALIEGPFDKDKFQFRKIKDDELVLAVSPEHEFSKKKEVSIEEVLNGNLILRENGSGTRRIFEDKLIQMGYNPSELKAYMEIGSISAIKSLIEENLGYSIISKETIKKELLQGIIKEIPIRDVRIFREFNFLYLLQDDYINEFMDFVSNENDKNYKEQV